ncbi:MAG: tetratricopeptide repeat protein [Ignavibacteriaceae bacterium]
MNKIFLIPALLFIFSSEVLSQNPLNRIDSTLISRINNDSGDKKINNIKELVRFYINNSPSTGKYWIEKGLELSLKRKNNKDKADFYFLSGKISMIQSDYKIALEAYNKSLDIYKRINDRNGIASAFNEIAYVSNYMGEFQQGLSYSYQAEKLAAEINDKINLVDAYNNISIAGFILKDSILTELYYKKALDLASRINYPVGLAALFVHKSIFLFSKSDFDLALVFAFKALKEYEKENYLRGISGTLENIGLLYRKKSNFQLARKYHFESLEIKQKIEDKQGIAASYANIALVYWDQKSYSTAHEYLNRSFKLRKSIDDLRGLSVLASFYSDIYAEEGNFGEALKYYKMFKSYNDSLFSEKKQAQINKLSAQYESEKKENQIVNLQKENEINKKLNYHLLIIIFLFLAISSLLTYYFIKKNKINKLLLENNRQILLQKEQLEALNKELSLANLEKDKLFAIIGHDLRSPFQSILGFSEIIETDAQILSKEEILHYFKMINQSNNQLFELINNLLNWSLIKLRRLKINPELFSPYKDIEKAIKLFDGSIQAKNLKVDFLVEKSAQVRCDRDSFSLIMRNLISNAVKYSKTGGIITISGGIENDSYQISVKDTGIGMATDIINDIFSENIKSTSGTLGEKGTGFGLMICAEMIEKNNGIFSIESQLNIGSEFKVTFKTT